MNAVVTSLSNSGTMFGQSSVRLLADGTATNTGALRSGGWLVLAGQAGGTVALIDNQTAGEIIAVDDLIVDATSVQNAGALASEQARLVVTASQDITNENTGLVFGKTLLQLQADGTILNDGGTLLAQGNLVVAGLTGAQAGQLINRNGGLIETTGGDINIAASVFENSRVAPVVTDLVNTTSVTQTLSGPGSCSGTKRDCLRRTTVTRVTTQQAAFSGNASQLISSGDINLNIGAGRNAYSLISAQGDVNLLAASFVNEGLDLQETTEVWHDFHRARKSGIFSSTKHTYWTVNDPTVVANIGAVFSTVEAGGAINGSVSGYLQNGAVQSGATSTSGTGTTPGYTTTNPGTSTLTPLNTSLAGLTGSSIGNPGLVVPVTTPNAPFLLETRFEFVNLENFLSSDYFLGEFNIDLADLEKRLGDAYVETLFIREQLFALTGQRLLNGAIDERAQMQAMYDNAIDAATNLDLAFGVALTPEQIAALTEDIIWLEEVEIDGQMVLVPHVYLASASTLANVNSASQFVARDIAVLAGEFVNSGTLNAEQGLQVASLGDFRNLGGSLIAGGNLSLDIAGTLHSVSGDIRGRNVAIAANEIVIETAALDHGRSDATAQTAARQSSITADENMTLQATEDLILIGADLNAGGDTVLVAGGDLIAGALALESHADMTFSGGYYRADGIENVVSSINGGGDVFMVSTGTASGGDLILEGAQVAAAGALTLRAEQGDVILAAAQDMFNSDLRGSSSGFLSKSESRDQVFDLSHQVVSLSGSSIDISASGSVLAEGTQFAIPGVLDGVSGAEALNSRDLRITAAGGDLTFAAVTDIHAESHFESSSFLGGLGGSMRDLKTLETTALGARADIAGDIRLRSAGDLTLTAVDFKAGGQFSTEVAGATRVLAAVDTSYRSLSEMNNNMVMITTVNSEDYTERATFSSIEAAGGVDFDVTSDVTLAGVRDQLISGQHAAQLLQDGDHGMAIAATFLGKTDPSTGPPTEGDTSDTSNWRDDLNVTVAALPTGEDGAGYLYLDGLTARDGTTIEAITLIDEHFYEETKALSPAFKALLTIVVTQGIGGLGGFGGGFGEMIGLSSDLAISAANAFASNLTVGVIDGAVTGNLDLGEIVKNATFSGFTAGLTSGINLEQIGIKLDDTGLLRSGGKLTLSAIGESALDSALRSGLNSAVYGSDFGKGLLSGISGSVVNLAMADVQHGIGDLFEGGANGGEGSFGHITLHALTGCVAAELQNASCASGAAGAAAQAIYAGTDPGAGTLTDDQIKNRAELIGGIAGFFASEGKGENVSTAASIARSGAENNYLSHQEAVQRRGAIELLAECVDEGTCSETRLQELEQTINYYANLDAMRDAMIAYSCQGLPGGNCARATQDARTAADSYLNDPDRYTVLGDDWMAAARAGSGAGPAWDPAAFGLGTAAGAALGLNTLLGAATVREAARLCGSRPFCTAALVTQFVGAEVGAEFSGGTAIVTAMDGTVLSRISLDPPAITRLATNRTPQVTINRQNGAEFEQQVIDALGPVGGVKNTTPRTVTLSNGTEVTTIPDLWGRNVGGLLEAKNVQRLSLSPQLRAQSQIARESGEPLNLVVSPRTQTVSGPLLNDVRSTGGNVFVYNPATDSLTPW
ncbi:putative toxin [Thalassobius sp. I31.1]|uniref:putative toxin n=1 Tax=Thalassobius sp. I31.1 TaxID=2109912 RepID=UPI000D1C0EFF|nr:putative toxin [Thalassobius sp. I31.1]